MTPAISPSAVPTAATAGPEATCRPSTRVLLACGVVSGPLFASVCLAQALIRPGFDLTRNAVSALTIGSWGWVQSLNFAVAGGLVLAAAAGARRTLRPGPGGTRAPRLLVVMGAGLLPAAVFHPDPSAGFPAGTPVGANTVSSWHGVLHMICGSLAFASLIAVCFVFAHRFHAYGRRRAAILSCAAGTAFAIALMAAGAPDGSLTLFLGVTTAWLCVALVCLNLTSTSLVRAADA